MSKVVILMSNEIPFSRCSWAETNTTEREYHDNEWGFPFMTKINCLSYLF